VGDDARWLQGLQADRAAKDQWFKHGHDSPIPHALRHQFTALAYYPPNPALHLRLRLQPNSNTEVVEMMASSGPPRRYLKWGTFEFEVEGQRVRLWAYRLERPQGEDYLFVPFRDATSGKETYGAGRYIDLHYRADGEYDLDFNQAYSPHCAYSPDYSCPLPPVENWLKVPIRAGEKDFLLKGESR